MNVCIVKGGGAEGRKKSERGGKYEKPQGMRVGQEKGKGKKKS